MPASAELGNIECAKGKKSTNTTCTQIGVRIG